MGKFDPPLKISGGGQGIGVGSELYALPRATHSFGERMSGDSTHLLRPLDGRFHVHPNGTQIWAAIARPLETFSGGSFSYFFRLVLLCYFKPKTRNLTRGF